jgi:hypothetical protein
MTKGMLERRLRDVSSQLQGLRRELALTDEQLAQLSELLRPVRRAAGDFE